MLRRLGRVLGITGLAIAGLFALAAINSTNDPFGWGVLAVISGLLGIALWYIFAGE